MPLLEARAIDKRFPGVKALESVDFALQPGEIHALMGENGAGKSTLIKVLTGVYRPDGGEIRFDGNVVQPRSPAHAASIGISTVYQEVNLVPPLSVAENLSLGRAPRRFGLIDWKRMRNDAETSLSRLGLRIDVTRTLDSYPIAVQQMVAIARAVQVQAKALILDEPTSSLDSKEVTRLFAIMRDLKAQGMGQVFVTHFLDQVYEVSDRITVLRNGKLVGSYAAAELSRVDLVSKMMGKELEAFEHATAESRRAEGIAPRATFVEARGLGRAGSVESIDLDLASGEPTGLAGLLGSGRTEVARMLFGLDRAERGTLRIDGDETRIRNPRQAVRHGFALSPEDRKTQGIIPDLSLRDNILLALQARRGWWRPIRKKKARRIVDEMMSAMKVSAASADVPIRTLSGGNQQKIILARWLATQPRLLMLDEPTRGIDVGAKAEIQRKVLQLCREGMSVLFISSELEEIVRCSKRVSVMRDRRKVSELVGDEVSEKSIMRAIAENATSTGEVRQ